MDRLLSLEVQNFRVTWFLNAGMDYGGTDFTATEETALRRAQKETALQISEIQNDLMLTKSQRDKEKHDSVGAYIEQLKVRAKEHGIKREKELGRGLELMHELFAVVGAFQRSNAAERAKLVGVNGEPMEKAEDVLTYITDYIQVEFKAVDDHFREHQQRFWIREM